MDYKILRPPLHKNFQLPSREELLGVTQGQLVKMIFQIHEENPERMWVKVTNQIGDNEWHGQLDNDPQGEGLSQIISAGDEVIFHPLDVVQIWKQ